MLNLPDILAKNGLTEEARQVLANQGNRPKSPKGQKSSIVIPPFLVPAYRVFADAESSDEENSASSSDEGVVVGYGNVARKAVLVTPPKAQRPVALEAEFDHVNREKRQARLFEQRPSILPASDPRPARSSSRHNAVNQGPARSMKFRGQGSHLLIRGATLQSESSHSADVARATRRALLETERRAKK